MSKGAVRLRPASRPNRVIIAVGVVLLVLAFIVFVVGIVLLQKKTCARDASASSLTQENLNPKCRYSEEAKRVGLPSFLEKVKNSYFRYNPDQIMWDPDLRVSGKKLTEAKLSRYLPYNPEPMQLKYKTDTSRYLLKEIMNKKIDEDKLKPRESKALAQVKHYLQHTFGVPFDENYYAGDWMMGPNFFCWQPICDVPRAIDGFALNLFPKTFADVRKIYYTLQAHKKTFKQYRKNLELGVKTGMVRALEDCKSGLNAFKEKYPQIAISDKPSGVFQEWYTKRYRSPYFLRSLNKEVEGQWKAFSNGKTVNESLYIALENGIGEPVLELIQYLEHKHMRHCLPNNVSSGLANLPVDHVYTDLVADKSVNTTKVLPTGQRLNGKDTYKVILSYFTTFNITPEEIYNKGQEQVDLFIPKAIEIAKNVTGESDYIMAVLSFVRQLNSYDQWHNVDIFPANESNKHAHKICSSPEQAQKHCPRRWAALQEWSKYIMGVMGMILPKITPFFYFSGRKITAANCPVATQPHFNPSQGTMFFKPSDSKCSKPSYFVLPFFLGDYGPKYQEWSVIGHEARPGHHTQMQGRQEHFRDKCGGVIKWLDKGTSYIAFQEGWALYAENPVLSDDVKLYEENILQRYGMYKWQVWRAVRLIVDTGLHYRGMERKEALAEFEEKTWDQTDFADKEVTRYMSVPGQATAYMLGRLELINMRKKAEKELGKRFNIRDFHYQVLSQGSAPITFLRGHIDRYVRCVKGELKGEICDLILMRSEEDEGDKEQEEEDEEDEDEERDEELEAEYERSPRPF